MPSDFGMITRCFALLLTLLLMMPLPEAVANCYSFLRLSGDEGWPAGQINAIHRDKRGHIWIATPEGLVGFDGYSFHTYRPNKSGNSYINSMIEDHAQRLWTRSNDHYSYFDLKRNQFVSKVSSLLSRFGLKSLPSRMTVDSLNHLWVGVTGEGIYPLPEKPTTVIPIPFPEELKRHEIVALAVVKQQIWAVFNHGVVARYPLNSYPNNAILKPFNYDANQWIVDETISYYLGDSSTENYDLFATRQGEVWVYGVHGVWRFDTSRGHLVKENLTAENDFVRTMVQDAEGRLWIGKDRSGIEIIDPVDGGHTALYNEVNDLSLPGNTITTMNCEANGLIWIGTYKNGMALYHPQLFLFDKGPRGDVNVIAQDEEGRLFIGYNDDGVQCWNPSHIEPNDSSASLIPHHEGECRWRHDSQLPQSLTTNAVVSLLPENNGKLWVGTFLGGLDYFDGSTFHHYRHDRQNPQSLADDNVWALQKDSLGMIWIATLSNGLQRFNPATGEWKRFNAATHGLISDYLHTLAPSRRGGLWIGTADKGFAFLSFRDSTITNYVGNRKGDTKLHSLCINQLCEDSRGWLWLATSEGAEIYLPDEDKLLQLPLPKACHSAFVSAVAEDKQCDMWLSIGVQLLRVKISLSHKNSDEKELFQCRIYEASDGLCSGTFNQRSLLCLADGRMAVGGVEGVSLFSPQNMDQRYTLHLHHEKPFPWWLIAIGALCLMLIGYGWRFITHRRAIRVIEGNATTANPSQSVYIEPQLTHQEIQSVDEKFVEKATRYVEANMGRSELSVEELSNELSMSRGHLYKRLTQLTGKSPLEFIRHIRLKRAATLLRESGLSVAEVAYEVGFNNPKYFSKYFKEEYGVLPSEYKNLDLSHPIP